MGTTLTVVAPADRPDVPAAVGRLFDAWDARLSRFRPDSELTALNAAAGRPFVASPVLFEVVAASVAAARATDGLFDPALLHRLVALGYDRTFDEVRARSRQDDGARDDSDDAVALDAVRGTGPWTRTAWSAIRLDRPSRTITLPRGTALDLGGIAKGMAVDAAIDWIRSVQVPFAAVSAGGDLAVVGRPPDADDWTIAVDGAGTRSVSLATGALATSTVLERRWLRGGRVVHHLIDPRTGEPSRSDVILASVAAPTCRQAEVAAKAALLLGREAGTTFLLRHDLAGLLVTDAGETWRIGRWSGSPADPTRPDR